MKSNNLNDVLLRSGWVMRRIGLKSVVGATIAYDVVNGEVELVLVEAMVDNLVDGCC